MIRHQILLQRLSLSQLNSSTPFYTKVEQWVKTKLNTTTRTFTKTELQTLKFEIQHILVGLSQTTLDNANDFALYEAEFTAKLLKGVAVDDSVILKAINKTVSVGLASNRQGKSLQAILNQFNSHKTDEILKIIKVGRLTNKSTEEIMASVTGLISNKILTQLTSIANTVVNFSASIAREAVFKANRDLIDYLLWNSILDGATTDFCKEHSGNKYQIGEGPRPPAHWNCRSFMSVVLREV